MAEKKTFYITTPIYYPSGDLHIGHTYTTVASDSICRFKKLLGYDAYFLTGTDEHGQKIQQSAEEAGKDPQTFVDEATVTIKALWEKLDIDYDQYIRTTDPEHIKTVQAIFKQLYDQGDIYKGQYEGAYCTPCESFWTDGQLVDGKCPDCHREVQQASEEAYFLKLSNYADRLLKHIEENPDFITPESRKNEMINNFIKPGLQDLCVSRTSFNWGVPVSFDPGHVVYVWIDALPNYISALGYRNDKPQLMDKYWPADIHMVGKDIIRFHTIYWPILLMAAGLPLPKKVYGHGWILLKGGKMSKSVGNVVDPVVLADKYGVDALRYHVLREMTFGSDGIYNEDLLVSHINADLANDLGNLLSRTVAMTVKYFEGTIPEKRTGGDFDEDLQALALQTPKSVAEAMELPDCSKALEHIWKLVSRANKYIDENTPWLLIKEEDKHPLLANVMYHLTETLRMVAVLLQPFLPQTGSAILEQLEVPETAQTWESLQSFGRYPEGVTVVRHDPLFPRVELPKKEKEEKKKAPAPKKQPTSQDQGEGKITIDDFAAVEMKVAEVLSCDQHPDADRLLVFQLDLGSEKRQIVSGIAEHYQSSDLIGKKVIVVTNLKPVNLRGVRSDGMILCATKGKKLTVLTVDDPEMKVGAKVS
ncbi:MAG: methionine--tRNA ligase [Eubacteriaceae bacterium]|jgi:methionyl-tRNA synthetase|nr:methionine--tRNA ligase [Eubacteriaceae bacterium]